MFFLNYSTFYLVSIIILLPAILISAWAGGRVHSTFHKFDRYPTASDWTGSDVARMLLERNKIYGVSVVPGKGVLTDNFNPSNMSVTLSQSTYSSNSIAAVAVAAHEIGHVIQREEGYGPYKLRSILVPITNFGSRIAIPLVIVGIILEFLLAVTAIGTVIVFIGVCAYGLSFLFTLITLPVELNASKRARELLVETGVLTTKQEIKGAKKVLSAAAMTYIASALVSLVYFLRFLAFILLLKRRR